jgi:hypothetical protein
MISDKDEGLDEKVYVLSVEACVEMKMYVDNDLKSVFSMCFLVRSRAIRYRAV